MPEFLKRMIAELVELDERICKLSGFINSDNFEQVSVSQQRYMLRQIRAMNDYRHALNIRVELAKLESIKPQ